ncbi:MAG: cation transporter [Chitinophagaceae bacterium]
MKTFRIFSFVAILMAIANFSFAQKAKTETIPVSGNCGMCKSNIEKAAKKAGAAKADWDVDAKQLTVTYNSSSTNAAKIQKGVAAAGYDTRDFKTTEEAYNKLHACCQYERSSDEKADCCAAGICEMKDGKCADMSKCTDAECCKNGTCGKKS